MASDSALAAGKGQLSPGLEVSLHSLKAAPHLNGRSGFLIGLDPISGRWRVDLMEDGVKALRPESLRLSISASVHSSLCSRSQHLAADAQLETSLPPSSADQKQAEACMASISKIARRLGAEVVLFGSWAQESALNGSDLDVALLFPGHVEEQLANNRQEKVQILKSFAAKGKGELRLRLVEVVEARVPILRMEFGDARGPEPLLELDVSVGSSVTGMLDDFIRDSLVNAPGCLPLLRLVKLWARRRNVNKALLTCLNSLSWTLLVLHFHVLSQVQGTSGTSTLVGGGRSDLGVFFAWVRHLGVLPCPRQKLSVREGRWLPRTQLDQDALLWLEDPTLASNNTARSVQPGGWQATLDELDRALVLLRRGEALAAVCSDHDAPSRLELAPPRLRSKLAEKALKREHPVDSSTQAKARRIV